MPLSFTRTLKLKVRSPLAMPASRLRMTSASLEQLKRDRTTFVVAHRIATADLIVVLRDGQMRSKLDILLRASSDRTTNSRATRARNIQLGIRYYNDPCGTVVADLQSERRVPNQCANPRIPRATRVENRE